MLKTRPRPSSPNVVVVFRHEPCFTAGTNFSKMFTIEDTSTTDGLLVTPSALTCPAYDTSGDIEPVIPSPENCTLGGPNRAAECPSGSAAGDVCFCVKMCTLWICDTPCGVRTAFSKSPADAELTSYCANIDPAYITSGTTTVLTSHGANIVAAYVDSGATTAFTSDGANAVPAYIGSSATIPSSKGFASPIMLTSPLSSTLMRSNDVEPFGPNLFLVGMAAIAWVIYVLSMVGCLIRRYWDRREARDLHQNDQAPADNGIELNDLPDRRDESGSPGLSLSGGIVTGGEDSQVGGPSPADPCSAGPSSTGPSSSAGPSSTGPSSTGPSSAGPSSAGPSSPAGPSSTDPSSSAGAPPERLSLEAPSSFAGPPTPTSRDSSPSGESSARAHSFV